MSVPNVAAARAVVLDTNALLLVFTEGCDLERELEALLPNPFELVVPSSVIGELKTLAQGTNAAARHAKSALKYATRARTVPTGLSGDDGLLEVARKLDGIVLTNDRTLQAEAAKSSLQVIAAREHGRLAFRKAGSG